MKTLSRDLKFGLIVIGALFLVYFGLNFLKGVNIFSPTRSYYAQYEDLGGLVASTPVYVKGYKVGQVDEIAYDFTRETPFTITFSVSKDIRLTQGTVVEMFDDGLMGGKAIRLLIPVGEDDKCYAEGDVVPSRTDVGLMGALTGSLLPKLESFSQEADSLIHSLRQLIEDESIARTLASAEKAAADLAATSSSLRHLMANDVPHILDKTDLLLGDLSVVSGNLKQIDYRATFDNLDHTLSGLDMAIGKINAGTGTLGALLNDRQLYIDLTNTASAADSLLIDLRQHPKRYVHFSLFGRKN